MLSQQLCVQQYTFYKDTLCRPDRNIEPSWTLDLCALDISRSILNCFGVHKVHCKGLRILAAPQYRVLLPSGVIPRRVANIYTLFGNVKWSRNILLCWLFPLKCCYQGHKVLCFLFQMCEFQYRSVHSMFRSILERWCAFCCYMAHISTNMKWCLKSSQSHCNSSQM